MIDVDTNKNLAGFAKITQNPPIWRRYLSFFSTKKCWERPLFCKLPLHILHSFVTFSGFDSFPQRFDLPILFLLFRWRVEALVPVNSHRNPSAHHPVIECHSSYSILKLIWPWIIGSNQFEMFGHGGDQHLIRRWWLSMVGYHTLYHERNLSSTQRCFFIHPPSQPACQPIPPVRLTSSRFKGTHWNCCATVNLPSRCGSVQIHVPGRQFVIPRIDPIQCNPWSTMDFQWIRITPQEKQEACSRW